MQVYLVGGAVRDELLGRSVAERDWVVVGATPDEMERLGYRAVGRDFPVYLHPTSQEEYALARLERKVGPGYRGFTTRFSPEVTLEQDLIRRDLTINAMARGADGTLFDPHGGREDLALRRLRHVSEAFAEDPVRILRIARFAARFADLGFEVAPETMTLMRSMVASGEVNALVPERLWRELQRALGEPHPEEFFRVLDRCGALSVLMPEVIIDAKALASLIAASTLGPDTDMRFAAVLSGNEAASIEALSQRLRIPNEHRDLALLAARLCPRVAACASSTGAPTSAPTNASQLLEWLEAADAFRRPERFAKLLDVCRARTIPGTLVDELAAVRDSAAAIALPREELAGLQGPAIAQRLRERRLHAIAAQSQA